MYEKNIHLYTQSYICSLFLIFIVFKQLLKLDINITQKHWFIAIRVLYMFYIHFIHKLNVLPKKNIK